MARPSRADLTDPIPDAVREHRSTREGLGNSIGWRADHGVLFLPYGVIWATVGAGMLLSNASVTEIGTVIGSQNIVLQALLCVLFLAVMAGLWIWHTDWPGSSGPRS